MLHDCSPCLHDWLQCMNVHVLRNINIAIATYGLAKCELKNVIGFLQIKGHNAAEIHHRKSKRYSENFISAGSVQDWCRKFREKRTDVYDEKKSADTVSHIEFIEQVIRGKQRYTIRERSDSFKACFIYNIVP